MYLAMHVSFIMRKPRSLCFYVLWRLELSLWLLAPLSTIFHISLLLADETGAR
jgi:hypothetical protein